eukprot:5323564-Pyramimonas_sp.AAC.1
MAVGEAGVFRDAFCVGINVDDECVSVRIARAIDVDVKAHLLSVIGMHMSRGSLSDIDLDDMGIRVVVKYISVGGTDIHVDTTGIHVDAKHI